MGISGNEAAGRVKGWFGVLLSLTPILALVPHPAIQAVAGTINEFVLALIGGAGIALQASSPAVVGKKKKA